MEYTRPQIRTSLSEWDNMSSEEEYNAHDHSNAADPFESQAWKSFSHCHALCESRPKCIQFSYDSGSCSISKAFRLGYAQPRERIKSGWMLDRVDDLFLELESKCSVRDWFSPEEGAITQKRK